jgi:hypothetical protein
MEGAMSYLKDWMIFRANNPQLSDSAARAEFDGTLIDAISDDRELTWAEIETLTGGRIGTFSVACPYCGPDKPWSTRMRVERRSYSYARWHCFYCGRSGAVGVVGPVDPEKEAKARQLAKEHKATRTADALRLWDQAEPISKDVTEYLHRRAIHELPPKVNEVLRWHPHCPFGHRDWRPCMVALYRDARTDKPVAIHRTAINSVPVLRRSLGPIAKAAVKLWPLAGSDQLVVGEGIETVLSAAAMTLGDLPPLPDWAVAPLLPAWAATVAINISGLPVVREAKRLIVLADNDASGIGYQAALQVYTRWRDVGREALILMPNNDKDFNDIARRVNHD